ncbi:MAG: hypothetical protein HY299_21930 [Verrucomicrobia bacterium]|nr:hypothetical protein [Verrucomicrobiota bacterium]
MKPPSDQSGRDESPGVPGFRSWRDVYLFVFAFFALCVALLTLFARAFA